MNRFIESLSSSVPQTGLFLSLASGYSAEVCGKAGFDWLLIESEHAPNSSQTLLSQAHALAPFDTNVVARPPCHEPWVLKQFLDLGYHTLLVPMVETADQARAIVAATRFPPDGIRGYAGMTSRASSFGEDEAYFSEANDRVGLILQIENRAGLEAVEDIATVEGVDAIFFGPGDLAADLGHLGHSGAKPVQDAISGAIPKVLAAGKPCGLFALSLEDAKQRAQQGASFFAVGVDIAILLYGAKQLAESARKLLKP